MNLSEKILTTLFLFIFLKRIKKTENFALQCYFANCLGDLMIGLSA